MLLPIVISLTLHFEMDLSPPSFTGSIFSSALKFCLFFGETSWVFLVLLVF